MLRALFPLCLIPLIAACGLQRPASRDCPAFPAAAAAQVTKSTQGAPDPAAQVDRMMTRTRADIEAALRAEVADTPARRTVTVHVVTLSAGGQYGAFGAGFLTGWSANAATPRPVFNLVTGVSAGAIMAPAVFAGGAFDTLLARYGGLGQDDILRRRALPALLRAPSIASPAPLEAFLADALDPALIGAVAAGHGDGRRLLIGATDIDSGTGEVFDLGAAATTANAAPCLREAMLASAAIPALFPPRHINGALYADGGLREHVFLRALDDARRDVARDTGRDIRVEAYLIVNGALLPPDRPVADTLPDYAVRSVEVLADEVLRDSIAEAVDFAAAQGNWRLRGIRADLPPRTCWTDADGDGTADTPPGDGIGGFDACLTRALFDHGRQVGSTAPIPWLSAGELRALSQQF